jgi:hypothetical protein
MCSCFTSTNALDKIHVGELPDKARKKMLVDLVARAISGLGYGRLPFS